MPQAAEIREALDAQAVLSDHINAVFETILHVFEEVIRFYNTDVGSKMTPEEIEKVGHAIAETFKQYFHQEGEQLEQYALCGPFHVPKELDLAEAMQARVPAELAAISDEEQLQQLQDVEAELEQVHSTRREREANLAAMEQLWNTKGLVEMEQSLQNSRQKLAEMQNEYAEVQAALQNLEQSQMQADAVQQQLAKNKRSEGFEDSPTEDFIGPIATMDPNTNL